MGEKRGRGAEDMLQPCQNQINTFFASGKSPPNSTRWPQKVKPKWELQGGRKHWLSQWDVSCVSKKLRHLCTEVHRLRVDSDGTGSVYLSSSLILSSLR